MPDLGCGSKVAEDSGRHRGLKALKGREADFGAFATNDRNGPKVPMKDRTPCAWVGPASGHVSFKPPPWRTLCRDKSVPVTEIISQGEGSPQR
jgi:hypothetical protein